MTSLAVLPTGRSPSTVMARVLAGGLRQGLGGEDVLDLAGADAEGQGAERAVGGGVASRRRRWSCPAWCRPCSGPMMWTMPWPGVFIGWSVMPNSAQLSRSVSTCLREIGSAISRWVSCGGDVVVLGGDGELGVAHGAAGEAEAVEGLRAGDLVDEVEVDEEQVGLSGATGTRRGRPRPSGSASGVRSWRSYLGRCRVGSA